VTPEQLSEAIVAALTSISDRGDVTLAAVPETVQVQRPKVREHGDYSTNVALQLAKPAGLAPRALAEALAAELGSSPEIAGVDVAGPGFINITVAAAAQGEVARTIVDAGPSYGGSERLSGTRINLEFVSANPTGPLHLGHTRWAAVGDSLARILEAAGADVTREYYFNDHGAQIDRFSRSLYAALRGEPIPEDGYRGEYVVEIADRVAKAHPEVRELDEDDAVEMLRRHGVDLMFDEIKQSLHDFGVDFDVYFHEQSLHESGAVERAIARLAEMGNTYESDGAIWMRTEQYGDDKDRVIIRSNGEPSYIAADLAYYLDKRERGFDLVVLMLGADHHGYVGRLMAMCQAFGDKPHDNLEVLIGQMVRLMREGEPLRLSKRAGTVIAMDDMVDAIGVDASRYALVRYSTDSNIELDLELWARAAPENPVYYVQYAHARSASILRNAADLGIASADEDFDPSLLSDQRERDLLRALAEFPAVVAHAADTREPHRVARYLEDTAAALHRFADKRGVRVLPHGDEPATDLHRARLLLVDATRIVFARGLGLLGVTAPERM
jgi:arginyl-tRNA synthetase